MAKKSDKTNGVKSGNNPTHEVEILYGDRLLLGTNQSKTALLETKNTILTENVNVKYTRAVGTFNPHEILPTTNLVAPADQVLFVWCTGNSDEVSLNYWTTANLNGNKIIVAVSPNQTNITMIVMPMLNNPGTELNILADGQAVSLAALVPNKVFLITIPATTETLSFVNVAE